jgi:hypothetical protein
VGADDLAVVEKSETVGGTQVVYVFGLRVSNPVPSELTFPDASDGESRTLEAELWSPELRDVSAVSAGTTDCEPGRSASAPAISMSGAASADGLSVRIGEAFIGATIVGFA